MLLSVLFPAAMILFARPAAIQEAAVPVAERSVPYMVSHAAGLVESRAVQEQVPAQAAAAASTVRRAKPQSSWKVPLPPDKQLVAAWIVASSVFALHLSAASILLHRRAAGWQRAVVQGQEVLISEVTGPALVGVMRPQIVVPRWLLAQPAATLALILEHERQHRAARDPLLIVAGLFVIAAAPWNLPLWWQWRRMRQAIELDCDARVMRDGAEATSYAQVLLAVSQRATPMPAGALAMSEPVHALERRIECLVPDTVRYAALQTSIVFGLAMAAAGAALALDAPALPGHSTAVAPMAAPSPGAISWTPASIADATAAMVAAAQSTVIAPAPRADEPPPAEQTPALAQLATKPASFMVRILSPVAEPAQSSFSIGQSFPIGQSTGSPRPSGSADTAAKARLEKYYAILVEKLTAVPGLKLITGATPDVRGVPYEISMRLGADWKGVVIEASSVPNPSGYKVQTTTRDASLLGNLLSAELRDAIPVDDPDRDMDRFVQRLRLELFPPDRALLDQMMSELRDPQLQPGLRAQALRQLMTVDSLYDSSGSRLDSFAGRLMRHPPDPALLGAATEVAMTDKDPELRLWLWNTLITDPLNPIDPAVLVAPAARALARETDLRVQLMLVNILNLSPANPQAHAALDSVANSDADSVRPELVRMAARRVLNGGAGWNDYFMTRLKDPQVPDTERLELINYVSYISSSGRWVRSGARMQLDEAAERSLGSLLKSPASTEVVAAAARLLGVRLLPVGERRGSSAAREELTDFMRAGTGKPEADPKVRRSVLRQLFLDLRSHPETRPLLEEIMARDRDPVLREAARQALEQTPLR
jgi:beta-lactamase regulating signal transducer with metallopeptidase domain